MGPQPLAAILMIKELTMDLSRRNWARYTGKGRTNSYYLFYWLHLFLERAIHIRPVDFAKSKQIFPKKAGKAHAGIKRRTRRRRVFGSPLTCHQWFHTPLHWFQCQCFGIASKRTKQVMSKRDHMWWPRTLQALWHCKMVPGDAEPHCAFHTF